ncbi:MAG: glycosyltransferase family 2 protein [Prevotella sp.]|jgi:GT2 family glycosyltransferase|nr:glycosyltransferase family 2 protein [Prevotella sp.]
MEIAVSIIIVNYNTAELLGNCIRSVQSKTEGVDYEIIVVDNNSEKESLDHLTEKYPTVHFIFSEENLGFGRANNLGVSHANGKYLFFLNPDTLLLNNAISILYEFMEANSQAGVCGGNMYKGDMTPASSYYDIDFLTLEYKIIFNRKRHTGFNHTRMPQTVNVIVGADLFIPASLFNKFKGFDPDFFLYFEEVELCYRIQKAGYKIISVPEAEIIHLQGGSAENKSKELNKWSYQEHWYSKFVYFSKTKGKFKTALLYWANMLKLGAAKAAYTLKHNPEKLDYWKKKSEVLKKTYSRYRQYLKR